MKFLQKHFGQATNFLVNSSIEVKEVIETNLAESLETIQCLGNKRVAQLIDLCNKRLQSKMMCDDKEQR